MSDQNNAKALALACSALEADHEGTGAAFDPFGAYRAICAALMGKGSVIIVSEGGTP